MYIRNAQRTDATIPGKIRVEAPIEGTKTRIASIMMMGANEIFQFFTKYPAPRAPKSAGITCLNAGMRSALLVNVSRKGAKARTPIARIIVVTIEDVAIAIVEITSPSSEFALTFALSIALIAQGSLRLTMLPVTNERYVPPAPSMGV